MARGVRKAASDSTRQALADQQAPDLSNAQAPRDVSGVEHLDTFGLNAYDELFKCRAEWSRADLILIAQASAALAIADRAETELKSQPLMVKPQRGADMQNPLIALIDRQRAIVRICLRDAHLRSRDGASPSTTAAAPASSGTKKTGGKNVTDFDAWLK